MLIWIALLLLGEGEGEGSGGIGPTPDVADDSRRRIGAFVIMGGVGRRGRG